MYRVVESVCDENPAITAGLAGFQTAFNKSKVFVAQIFETEQFRSLPLNGITMDKAADRAKLCKSVAKTDGFNYACAPANGNETPCSEVDFTHPKFLQVRENQLVANSRNIHNPGTANLNALKDYGVTQAKPYELQTAVNAFKTSIVKPRVAKGQIKGFTK